MEKGTVESHQRSIIKGITWRITATVITIILVYVFTGNIKISLGVGAIEVVAKLIFYYFHERIWNKVSWGRKI